MNNSERIRDFFRQLADGLIINANSDSLESKTNSNIHVALPKGSENCLDLLFRGHVNDFGVGLPPSANG